MSTLTAENWPIAAAALPFPGRLADGRTVTEAGAEEWARSLADIADAGFDLVDITDSWLRIGDLDERGLTQLAAAGREAGVRPASVSVIRQSVIDHDNGDANLAYSHRTLEAAAALGIETVSFGLHQALTAEQQKQLWFWTVEGHRDDPADWDLAVSRLRELGTHAAELGIVMSLEMYEDTFLGTADSSVRLVQDIGLTNVGLNPDIGNLVRLHRPIESWWEVVEKTLPYSNFWHVKNYARDEDLARDQYFAVPTPMAQGVIDYRRAFRYAIEQGFQGVICVENYGGDGLSVCADNRDYLRRHVLPKRAGYALGESRVDQPTHSALRGERA
ncbi:MAG TPA: sugar phosphate isomerase/epimerase family protein [Microbacterium sp.]|nr:sugar phosphate isomerase/epimerase family protein [Microbacterium sp.]